MKTITLNNDGSLTVLVIGAAMLDGEGQPILDGNGEPLHQTTQTDIAPSHVAKFRRDPAFDADLKAAEPAKVAQLDAALALVKV